MRALSTFRQRAAAAATSVAVAALVASSAPGVPTAVAADAPAAVRPADQYVPPAVPVGLSAPGWEVESPAVQAAELGQLTRQPIPMAPLGGWAARAGSPAAVAAASMPAAPPSAGAVAAVAVEFALAQQGRPYVWGATGPAAYDCSGLTQRSYATAGVPLPRVSADQARAGTPVRLLDLQAGDLLFWAYDPANLNTVHHVAMYLGGGYVVHAPQPGEVVEVAAIWLSGYAGAVRVAGVPTTAAVPTFPGLPGAGGAQLGTGPAGDPTLPSPPRTVPIPGGSTPPGTTPPGTTPPATTPPASTPPASTPPPSTPPPSSEPPPTTEPPASTDPAPPPSTDPPTSAPADTEAPSSDPPAPTTSEPATTTPAAAASTEPPAATPSP
ncbi:MAG TPA: C40 family peptidase [Mycobacteriales bacterium]|nr:C40 family peptidase [Mycobacteriales bacterium]